MTNERWHDLMSELGLSTNDDIYTSLIAAYSQPHRHYHNVVHVAACLGHLDTVSGDADKSYEIELALWFHDAVYDPFSASNERDSADWAVRFMHANAMPEDIIARVEGLIMVTMGHVSTSSGDEQLMIDIDLSILGESPQIYDRFETAIRKEYSHVPVSLFREKRGEILKQFLGRERIYHTPHFVANFESQARINLANAIAAL